MAGFIAGSAAVFSAVFITNSAWVANCMLSMLLIMVRDHVKLRLS